MTTVACDGAVRALGQAGLAPGTMDIIQQDRAGTLTKDGRSESYSTCIEDRA